jgi:hypothetical protein
LSQLSEVGVNGSLGLWNAKGSAPQGYDERLQKIFEQVGHNRNSSSITVIAPQVRTRLYGSRQQSFEGAKLGELLKLTPADLNPSNAQQK